MIEDFAHLNQWLQSEEHLTVTGSPAQLPAPEIDLSTTVAVRDVVVEFSWEIPPVTGSEAHLAANIRDEDGNDVTDLVPWLGADGHIVFVERPISRSAGHTHAWSEGMDAMSPGHDDAGALHGPLPAIPLPRSSSRACTRRGIQFARAAAPDDEYTVPFLFEVSE